VSIKLVPASDIIEDPPEQKAAEPQPAASAMRLWLGCNQRPRRGWVNVDIENYPGVDVCCDLEKRWPWEDSSVDEIACADLPEHIRQWWDEYDVEDSVTVEDIKQALTHPRRVYGIIHFMNEAHRVLKVGGLLDCLIPSTEVAGNGAWQDPTHVSYWNINTLLYFCDVPGNYRNLYPSLIKCKYRLREGKTQMPNIMGVTYLHFIAEKIE
jgi:hypothetical protein